MNHVAHPWKQGTVVFSDFIIGWMFCLTCISHNVRSRGLRGPKDSKQVAHSLCRYHTDTLVSRSCSYGLVPIRMCLQIVRTHEMFRMTPQVASITSETKQALCGAHFSAVSIIVFCGVVKWKIRGNTQLQTKSKFVERQSFSFAWHYLAFRYILAIFSTNLYLFPTCSQHSYQ